MTHADRNQKNVTAKQEKTKKVNDINCLIISSTIDYSTDLICHELEQRSFNYLRINRDRFPKYELLYTLQSDSLSITMNEQKFRVSSGSLKSVYFRAPVFLRSTGKPYTLQEQLRRGQWSSFIRNLITFDCPLWVNHPVSTYRAENKMFQLRSAQKFGLSIPESYFGNTLPESIIPERMYIVKSLDAALFYDNGHEMFTYSTEVKGEELLTANIQDAPIIVQECLQNKVDIRVTVVGNRLFAVAITNNGQKIDGDWRKTKKEDLLYTPISLPSDIQNKTFALMQYLGLSFGGVDLALVGNTYYFIEVNPTGEWGWLTTSARLPIDKAIVDLLVSGGKP